MSDREAILARLPSGVESVLPKPWPTPDSGSTRSELWESFAEKLGALGAKFVSREDLRAQIEALNPGKTTMASIDADARTLVEAIPLIETDIWEAQVGFTLAEVAIAHSGSLLVANAPGRRRMASLAPQIHVVFVPEDRIVWSLEEALARVPERSCVLITGSSRTADIESVLVRGVHGPKEVWVVPV